MELSFSPTHVLGSFLSKITIDKVQNVLDENEAIIDILFANERVIVSCIAENNMNAVIYESDTLINLTKKALKSINNRRIYKNKPVRSFTVVVIN